jgi:hypothetical protein
VANIHQLTNLKQQSLECMNENDGVMWLMFIFIASAVILAKHQFSRPAMLTCAPNFCLLLTTTTTFDHDNPRTLATDSTLIPDITDCLLSYSFANTSPATRCSEDGPSFTAPPETSISSLTCIT